VTHNGWHNARLFITLCQKTNQNTCLIIYKPLIPVSIDIYILTINVNNSLTNHFPQRVNPSSWTLLGPILLSLERFLCRHSVVLAYLMLPCVRGPIPRGRLQCSHVSEGLYPEAVSSAPMCPRAYTSKPSPARDWAVPCLTRQLMICKAAIVGTLEVIRAVSKEREPPAEFCGTKVFQGGLLHNLGIPDEVSPIDLE